jgi:predicted AAA+ superfamily ATPase
LQSLNIWHNIRTIVLIFYRIMGIEFYPRLLMSQIEDALFDGYAIIIYGARRVGKTTLCQNLVNKYSDEAKYINCENPQVKEVLLSQDPDRIKRYLADDARILVLDEAQVIEDIGQSIKIFVDTYPEIQVIATGSSSFDLANKIGEPLVGRQRIFHLHTLSMEEIANIHDALFVESHREDFLRFGLYPRIFNANFEKAIIHLEAIAKGYLYKDIFAFERLRKPKLLDDLLKLLALQLGNEVNYNELSNSLRTDRKTVERYLDLLEKTFVIFKLNAFSRNPRNEVGKSFKVYFYDLGIRNYLINNVNSLDIRNDVGALWENFCVLERIKRNENKGIHTNQYFWRTYDQKEIDYIEETGGHLYTYEFKWKQGKRQIKMPKAFAEAYTNSSFKVITPENYLDFVL